MKKMRLKEGRPETEALKTLVEEARGVARPKAFYRVCRIQSRGSDCIVIDGVELKSRVLRVNTEGLNRVFPFVATCGEEMARWADGFTDMLSRYYAGELKMEALRAAMVGVEKDIARRFDSGAIAQMQPGSLEDWSIYQQTPLFKILGDGGESVGVRLNSSLVMVPDKSESGIFFQNDSGYVNCKLCPIKKCPTRTAKYDKDLFATFGVPGKA
ncbi:MAG: vitamin B12 dependent methionine synthase [Desulfobacterales bacterium]|nr:vitamin B12 dependent methionine synthase [Desulfobacterales bacterium]